MRILFHAAGLLVFICLFLLGKIAIERRSNWAGTLALNGPSQMRLSRFFLYTGAAFEAIASLFGFLEGVAMLVLASGWVSGWVLEQF